MSSVPTIFVIDSDPEVRELARGLSERVGAKSVGFESLEDFIHAHHHEDPNVILLEVNPQDDASEGLPSLLESAKRPVPVIVLTDRTDVATAVRLMERGAYTVLEKPVNSQELADHISQALRIGDYMSEKCRRLETLNRVYEELTERQQSILECIEAGYQNKKIAGLLGISQRTVEAERARILSAFETESSMVMVARSTELRLLSEACCRFDERGGYVFRTLAMTQPNASH